MTSGPRLGDIVAALAAVGRRAWARRSSRRWPCCASPGPRSSHGPCPSFQRHVLRVRTGTEKRRERRTRLLPWRSGLDASATAVVIVGGGFGGLYAAGSLGRDPEVAVTLVDRRNLHLFQPLLYQVATGALSPGEIAQPLRSILRKQREHDGHPRRGRRASTPSGHEVGSPTAARSPTTR